MKPTPVQDLSKFLSETGRPFTEANIRQVAKMLSMTEGELQLALALKDTSDVRVTH